MERIIKASSNEGDVVADFFCGGGTTPVVVQRLGRRWIACDNSRIAMAVTADRLVRLVDDMSVKSVGSSKPQQISIETRPIQQTLGEIKPFPDFTMEHWGIYEITRLIKMSPLQFRRFVIEAYNGRPDTTHDEIHGYKDKEPLYVGSPNQDERITKEEVVKFAEAVINKKGMHRGTMLAWAFTPEARLIAEKIASQERVSLEFVKLLLVPIDSPAFKSHLVEKDSRYTNLLSFVLPPAVRIGAEKVTRRIYRFDVSESVSMNPGGKIINVQWDFNYRGHFSSTYGYSFVRGKDNKVLLKTEYEFLREGEFTVACRVQDDLGGEATLIKKIEVE